MSFDERARTWDDDPGKVATAAEVAAAVLGQIDLSGRPRTLELGAGTGLLSRALRPHLGPTTLADSSPGMLEVARAVIAAQGLDGWRAIEVDVDRDVIPGGPFDLVVAQLAVHHMAHPRAVLQQIHEVLAPGGQVAIADLDLDPQGDFHQAHGDFTGHHGFDREAVTGWLRDLGFVEVAISTATSITKPSHGQEQRFPLFLATGRRAS